MEQLQKAFNDLGAFFGRILRAREAYREKRAKIEDDKNLSPDDRYWKLRKLEDEHAEVSAALWGEAETAFSAIRGESSKTETDVSFVGDETLKDALQFVAVMGEAVKQEDVSDLIKAFAGKPKMLDILRRSFDKYGVIYDENEFPTEIEIELAGLLNSVEDAVYYASTSINGRPENAIERVRELLFATGCPSMEIGAAGIEKIDAPSGSEYVTRAEGAAFGKMEVTLSKDAVK